MIYELETVSIVVPSSIAFEEHQITGQYMNIVTDKGEVAKNTTIQTANGLIEPIGIIGIIIAVFLYFIGNKKSAMGILIGTAIVFVVVKNVNAVWQFITSFFR